MPPKTTKKEEGFTTPPSEANEEYTIHETKGILYLYSPEAATFEIKDTEVAVKIRKEGQWGAWLNVASQKGETITSSPLDSEMTPNFLTERHTFVWNVKLDKKIFTWGIKMADQEAFYEFQTHFASAMHEATVKDKFKKISKDDQEWLTKSYTQKALVEYSSEEEKTESESETEDSESEDEKPNKQRYTNNPNKDSKNSAKNSALSVGYRPDGRSYVLRGNQLGVFSRDQEAMDMEYQTTLMIKDLKGLNLTPSKMQLHQQDSSMIFQDKKDLKKLWRMDLEVGKVVDEWGIHDDFDLEDFTPDTKDGQTTNAQTLVGIGSNALFRIDPRLSGSKMVDGESKTYAGKMAFSCLATNNKGEVVIASNKGDIRLYNKLDKIAKTHLPGFGDPVLGVDTTETGHYILVTCKNYILLIDTVVDGVAQNGFTKSMGQKKPIPIRMQLNPEHAAQVGSIKFTPARFGTGNGEKSIITSTGPYLIIWDFKKVKRGDTSAYSMRKHNADVIAENFVYNNDKEAIITLPDDVTTIARDSMYKPEKLLTPQKNKNNSRNSKSIVNSPW